MGERMSKNLKYALIIIAMVLTCSLTQFASAKDLIVVASKETQKATQDWLDFLKSKQEITVKLVTPESFSDHKQELYIFIPGTLNESKELNEIAKDALTADEFESIKTEAKMFYKPQAWNVGQKVILVLGPNMEAAVNARIATQEEWYEMLQDWFDIQDSQGFHLY